MEKVKVINVSMVKPASPTPSNTVWLSNFDLFAAWYHVPAVYFFRPTASIAIPSAADLKISLSRVLVPYHPFAGRLTRSPDGRSEIKCTAEGAYFTEAVSELSLDEFGVYTPSVENCHLLVPAQGSGPSEKNEESTPILLVQLTTFRCGGVCLAIALSHQAADGISASRFTCAWAAATRKRTLPIPDASFDHTPLAARSPPTVRFSHPEFDIRPRPAARKPVSFAYLYLKPAQIQALKVSVGGKYSSYETVAGHIWRCSCLARDPAQPDEEVRLLMTADVRRRLRPPLTEGYVGNAIIPTVAVAKMAEVVDDIPAARIRAAIVKLNDDYLRSALDFLEMQEDKWPLSRSAGNFSATDLSVTSWMQLPFHDVDFGWGPAEFMGAATFYYARQCCVMKTPDGGVKVGISLETDYMEGFKELFHGLLPAQKASYALSDGN